MRNWNAALERAVFAHFNSDTACYKEEPGLRRTKPFPGKQTTQTQIQYLPPNMVKSGHLKIRYGNPAVSSYDFS